MDSTPVIQADCSAHRRGRPRKTNQQQADFLVGCTPDERAMCVRLVRLLRDNYWVSELVRQILKKEAETPNLLAVAELRKLLDDFSTIEALADNAQKLGNNWSDHPILRAIRDEWEEINEYKSERAIDRLIKSARK